MFGDGRSVSEVQQILSPGVVRLINMPGSDAFALGIFTLTVDPQSWFTIQRFTDPKTGQPAALPAGTKWVQDLGGQIIGQQANQIQIKLPYNSLTDLASLPMVKYIYTPLPEGMSAADIKVRQIPSQIIPSIKNFLTQEQWGLPMWSWLTIAGGLVTILYGMRKKRTFISKTI